MVRLLQHERTGYWTRLVGGLGFLAVHQPSECEERPCAIHNRPSDHRLKDAPLNWRTDRGILERICGHGVGHPDADSAEFLKARGLEAENIHGCCGCC